MSSEEEREARMKARQGLLFLQARNGLEAVRKIAEIAFYDKRRARPEAALEAIERIREIARPYRKRTPR